MEELRERLFLFRARPVLERIEEVEEPIHDRTQSTQAELPSDMDITNMSLLHFTSPRVSEAMSDIDPSELPTQKLHIFSQHTRKRTAEQEIVTTPRRQRSIGYVSFRLSQQRAAEINVPDAEAERENISVEHKSPVFRPRRSTVLQETSQIQDVIGKEAERSVTAMSQDGAAGMQIKPAQEIIQPTVTTRRTQRHRRESSETPLGSLDRTAVSLGDSEQTTDSQRFIRDQWGTEGTMVKILMSIKAELTPVTVKSLVDQGPVIPGHKKLIAARCFTSMLKLKQHGFINIIKNPVTLEIEGVTLGPKFD